MRSRSFSLLYISKETDKKPNANRSSGGWRPEFHGYHQSEVPISHRQLHLALGFAHTFGQEGRPRWAQEDGVARKAGSDSTASWYKP